MLNLRHLQVPCSLRRVLCSLVYLAGRVPFLVCRETYTGTVHPPDTHRYTHTPTPALHWGRSLKRAVGGDEAQLVVMLMWLPFAPVGGCCINQPPKLPAYDLNLSKESIMQSNFSNSQGLADHFGCSIIEKN